MYPSWVYSVIPRNEIKQLCFSEEENKLKVSIVEPQLLTYNTDLFSKAIFKENDNNNIASTFSMESTNKETTIPVCMQEYLIDKGRWISSPMIAGNPQLESASTGSGNVFGNNGVYIVGDEGLKYPVFTFNDFNSDQELKDFFSGVILFKHNELSPEFSFPANGVGMTYCFENHDNKYISEFVLNPEKANGAFVERHPFPHIFTPDNKESTGVIVVGKETDKGYYFCAIKIGFGEAIYLAENVIHSDSSTIGELFIAFTEGVDADSVLLKDKHCQIVNPYK